MPEQLTAFFVFLVVCFRSAVVSYLLLAPKLSKLRHEGTLLSSQDRMSCERVNPPYRRYFHGNSSQAIFRSLLVLASEIQRWSENRQSCDANLTHVNNPSGFTRIFILHENIHLTRAETLSAGRLDTISKNILRWITFRIRPILGITLHLLIVRFHSYSSFIYNGRLEAIKNNCISQCITKCFKSLFLKPKRRFKVSATGGDLEYCHS